MDQITSYQRTSPFRSAVRSAFAGLLGRRTEPTAWQAGDDLHTAYARRIGVPVAPRKSDLDTPRPAINRADIRAARPRAARLDTYARRLTSQKDTDQ